MQQYTEIVVNQNGEVLKENQRLNLIILTSETEQEEIINLMDQVARLELMCQSYELSKESLQLYISRCKDL